MKPRADIGIDNGTTGAIGIIHPNGTDFFKTPTITVPKYTKAPAKLKRVDFQRLVLMLQEYTNRYECFVALENPLTSKRLLNTTILAARSHEATMIALEYLNISRYHKNLIHVSSRDWQKIYLPRIVKGQGKKVASLTLGINEWPEHRHAIISQGDADALYLAKYRKGENTQ